MDILVGIFNVGERKILDWLESENLNKKIARAASDSVYLQDVVNALKKYPKQDK